MKVQTFNKCTPITYICEDRYFEIFQKWYHFSMSLAKDVGKGHQTKSVATTNVIDKGITMYRNDTKKWKWEEHNFSMAFQSDSLPSGTANTAVLISVTSGEDYVLPMQIVPVSMFFSIQCQHKFQKSVLVSIEHFSAVTSDLSFVVSSNPQPPFHFELLSGGNFFGRYGLIERNEFSILGIVTKIRTGRWPEKVYYNIQLYTSPSVNYKWTVFIYIMKDSTTNNNLVKKDANESERTYNVHAVAEVTHTIDYFIMDISMNDENRFRGWQLPPESINPIRISRRRIDENRGVPTPANFKIILDVSKKSNWGDLEHCYKIAEVVLENSLALQLSSPQTSPGKYKYH